MNAVEQEFEKILDEITEDLFDAKYQSALYRKLMELGAEYSREFNQTLAFWGVVRSSLQESSVLALARAYDQRPDGINLITLINFVRNNVDLFGAEKFRERLKDNAHVDSLVQDRLLPNEEQFSKHTELVGSKDPLVNKLIQIRSNIIAHKSKGQILGTKKAIASMDWDEFDSLVDRGFEICNYYRDLYNACRFSANGLVGKDDYQYVLKYLRIAMTTLQFTGRVYSYLHQDSLETAVEQFAKEVYQEIYKQL